jgi:hypothetical protein
METLFTNVLIVPRFRLSVSGIVDARPSKLMVFAGFLASYFFIFSGIVYDMINEPPSMGQSQDPVTGACVHPRLRGDGLVAPRLRCSGGAAAPFAVA